jgi:type VI secretion system protein ImpC
MAETLHVENLNEATELSDFEKLVNQEFKPQSDETQKAIQGAVKTLLGQALENVALVSGDIISTIQGIIAELDKKLSE